MKTLTVYEGLIKPGDKNDRYEPMSKATDLQVGQRTCQEWLVCTPQNHLEEYSMATSGCDEESDHDNDDLESLALSLSEKSHIKDFVDDTLSGVPDRVQTMRKYYESKFNISPDFTVYFVDPFTNIRISFNANPYIDFEDLVSTLFYIFYAGRLDMHQFPWTINNRIVDADDLLLETESYISFKPLIIGGGKDTKRIAKALKVVRKLQRKPKTLRPTQNKTNKMIQRVFSANAQIPASTKIRKIGSTTGPLSLSKAALRYLIALTNGFHPSAFGITQIASDVGFSYPCTSVNRLDLTIGTAGVGWLLVCPSVANDTISAMYTTNTFTGSLASPLSAANTFNTGVAIIANATLPFASTAFTQRGSAESVTGRIVAVHARVQYTGTTMNQGGLLYCYADPNHQSTSGMAITDVSQFPQTDVINVERKYCDIIAHAIAPAEIEFPVSSPLSTGTLNVYPYSTADNNYATGYLGPTNFTVATGASGVLAGIPIMIVMATGLPGNTFHVDIATHVEYTGIGAAANQTPCMVDVAGAHRVLQASKLLALEHSSNKEGDRFTQVVNLLKKGTRQMAPVAVPLLIDAAAALI